jgi:hypothetical protein
VSERGNKARDAMSEMRDGLDSAKRLVERTRALLRGEASYDDNELLMCARKDGGGACSEGA